MSHALLGHAPTCNPWAPGSAQVVLPEGSTAITASVPFEVAQSFDTKFTYLDTSGRPVLLLHKKNLVPDHATKFHVDYSFGTLSMLREPLLLVAGAAVNPELGWPGFLPCPPCHTQLISHRGSSHPSGL